MKIKIKKVGDLCRHCGTPVLLKESNKIKSGKPCIYTHYLWCFVCNTIYFVPEYKLNKEKLCQSQQILSFDNPTIQNQSPLVRATLSSSRRLKVRNHLQAGSTRLLNSTKLDFKNLMGRLQKIADRYGDSHYKESSIVPCPDCGTPMIKRASKWGKGYWWGCGAYPKCKTTKKDN